MKPATLTVSGAASVDADQASNQFFVNNSWGQQAADEILVWAGAQAIRENPVKARALIEGSTYGPDTLKLMTSTFDKTWGEIAHHFEGDDAKVTQARERLAHALLAVADEDVKDADALGRVVLKILALGYGRALTTSHE